MNVDLSNGTVASIIAATIATVIAAIMGKPIGEAWRSRRKHEERAGELEADAAAAAAEFEVKEYRRTDTAIDKWAARVERAEKALDEALSEKRRVADDAASAIKQIREEAREDVHKNANWAMDQVRAVREQATAEIERVQHAAEARILASEAQHRADMGALHDRVRAGEQKIELLNERNRECEESSRRLMEEIAELKAWQRRSDVMGRG